MEKTRKKSAIEALEAIEKTTNEAISVNPSIVPEAGVGLVMIECGKIMPHPKNPRQSLGDISELTESIRANGVLQNLTVVPVIDAQPENDKKNPAAYSECSYTCVIGHRRLAAAKAAGLNTVPCVVANLDYKEQLSTMLLENMQRSDLTVMEQAEAVQLMLDLGDTVQTLAKKTGLSEQTVRRRAQIALLDKERLMWAEEKGARLTDFVDLEKIEDIEVRNGLLSFIGTANFKMALLDAQRKQAVKKNREKWLEKLNSFAKFKKCKSYNCYDLKGYSHISSLDFYNDPDEFQLPELSGIKNEYVYLSSDAVDETQRVYLHRKRSEEQQTAQIRNSDKRLAKFNEKSKQLRDLEKDFRALHIQHLANLSSAFLRKSSSFLCEYTAKEMNCIRYVYMHEDDVRCIFPLAGELKAEHVTPEKVMLLLIIRMIDGSSSNGMSIWKPDWEKKRIVYTGSDRANNWYELLKNLNYRPGDIENQYRDGSHPLYYHKRGGKTNDAVDDMAVDEMDE